MSKICSRGISMLPLISPDALVQIDFSIKKYTIGDIVVFFHNQQLLIHRIIAISTHNKFLIKGDNNLYTDGFLKKKALLGKVVAVKNADRFISITRTPYKQLQYVMLTYSFAKLLVGKLLKTTRQCHRQ